jgi:hypothetical protein
MKPLLPVQHQLFRMHAPLHFDLYKMRRICRNIADIHHNHPVVEPENISFTMGNPTYSVAVWEKAE